MYSGADLDTLLTALNTLTNDDFFEYDFNVGEIIPYLSITISGTQISLYPAIATSAETQPLIPVYYTTDFTPLVGDFIAAFQDACSAYASSSYATWNDFYETYAAFTNFLTLLASKE